MMIQQALRFVFPLLLVAYSFGCGDSRPQVELGPKSKDAIDLGAKKEALLHLVAEQERDNSFKDAFENILISARSEKLKEKPDHFVESKLLEDQKQSVLVISAPYVSRESLFDTLYGGQTASCEKLAEKFKSVGADLKVEQQKIQIETAYFELSRGEPILTCGRSIAIIAVVGDLRASVDTVKGLQEYFNKKWPQFGVPNFYGNIELYFIELAVSDSTLFSAGHGRSIALRDMPFSHLKRNFKVDGVLRGKYVRGKVAFDNGQGGDTFDSLDIRAWFAQLDQRFSISAQPLLEYLKSIRTLL